MDVCKVDESVIEGLLEMPFSLRITAEKLTIMKDRGPPPPQFNLKCIHKNNMRTEFYFKYKNISSKKSVFCG
jgi:hypothetical protein